LTELEKEFGLEYKADKNVNIINATGVKMNYYSTNGIAKYIGYNPKNTSSDDVVRESYKSLGGQ